LVLKVQLPVHVAATKPVQTADQPLEDIDGSGGVPAARLRLTVASVRPRAKFVKSTLL
jgi:hypothetical protein